MLSNYEGEKDDYNYISKKINYDQGFYEDLRSMNRLDRLT